MCFVSKASKREQAMYRHGPLQIQDWLSARGFEAAPDIIALDCHQQICGEFDGYGPAMKQGATMTIRRPAGSQWILVPREIAARCRGLIGTALTIRRRRNGTYDVKTRRSRARSSVIYKRQIIVDEHLQSREVARALRANLEIS